MDGVMEIITGRERRRRWSMQDKLRLAESNEPGALIRAVAARDDVSASLLFTWRRLARQGLPAHARESPRFLPVQMIKTAATPPPAACGEMTQTGSQTRPALSSDLIEIELSSGRRIRVGNDVNLAALRRVGCLRPNEAAPVEPLGVDSARRRLKRVPRQAGS